MAEHVHDHCPLCPKDAYNVQNKPKRLWKLKYSNVFTFIAVLFLTLLIIFVFARTDIKATMILDSLLGWHEKPL